MAPKMGPDADGDVPPCGVLDSRDMAEDWDAWKQERYRGNQKEGSLVLRYHTEPSSKEAVPTQTKPLPFFQRLTNCFRRKKTFS